MAEINVAGNSAPPRSNPRIVALIAVIPISILLFPMVHGCWANYWILHDGERGMAEITIQLSIAQNTVAYRYIVNQKEYTGKSARNDENPRYRDMPAGGHSPVYYSASHPWLSSLKRPDTIIPALPVVCVLLWLECTTIITLIDPSNKWAIRSQ